MNAVTFISAYRSLRPAEKAFVDDYVQRCEQEALARNERIALALHRPVEPDPRGYLQMPMVCAAIAERITQIAADSELSVNRVIREIAAIAFSSMDDFCVTDEASGQKYLSLSQCTPEQMRAVAGVEMTEGLRGRQLKIKLHSKLDALKMLATYVGALETDNPHWRAEQAKQIGDSAALPADISTEGAADRYARLING
jgi:hypothetical protein